MSNARIRAAAKKFARKIPDVGPLGRILKRERELADAALAAQDAGMDPNEVTRRLMADADAHMAAKLASQSRGTAARQERARRAEVRTVAAIADAVQRRIDAAGGLLAPPRDE